MAELLPNSSLLEQWEEGSMSWEAHVSVNNFAQAWKPLEAAATTVKTLDGLRNHLKRPSG